MLKSKWVLAAAFAGILTSTGHAACTKPSAAPTNFPDGATADLDTMVAAQKQVQGYLKSAQGYVNCIDSEESAELKKMEADKSLDKDAKEAKIKELQARRNERNHVVDQMKSTGDAFNAEIHKYQQAHKK